MPQFKKKSLLYFQNYINNNLIPTFSKGLKELDLSGLALTMKTDEISLALAALTSTTALR